MANTSVVITDGIVKRGAVLGSLEAIGHPFRTTWSAHHQYRCVVRCLSCGKVFVGHLGYMTTKMLEKGKGCKCLNIGAKTHGKSRSSIYRLWQSMRNRCRNKDDPNYGGRGIAVCEEWSDFGAFEHWVLANGWRQETGKGGRNQIEIDRFPNRDGNYEPGNCRIATKTQNNRNSRKNRFITAFGETKCVSEWVEDQRCVVSQSILVDRLNLNWNPEEAIATAKQMRLDIRAAAKVEAAKPPAAPEKK